MHVQEGLSDTPEANISEIWEQLDVDKSGNISFKDFKKLVKTVLELKYKMATKEDGSSPLN